MIPGSPAVKNQPDWQKQMAAAIRDPAELLARLGLSSHALPPVAESRGFGLRVSESYLQRMRYADPADPLLRQVWPAAAENLDVPGFSADPLEEAGATPVPGLIHKYANRALLIASASCAIHCRYCFRRHFPYADNLQHPLRIDPVLDYLRRHPRVEELILSGGDPLSQDDERLALLVRRLESLESLQVLRLHTRLPVVLPDRVDAGLLGWLGKGRLRKVMVLHINHPQEIDAGLARACQRLRDVGVLLYNQSVLLAGVNDDARVLAGLSRHLLEIGVQPYYLHLLDPVAGSAEFDVTPTRAKSIYAALEASVSGYLLPRLVREIPGAAHKVQSGSPEYRDAIG